MKECDMTSPHETTTDLSNSSIRHTHTPTHKPTLTHTHTHTQTKVLYLWKVLFEVVLQLSGLFPL